MVNMAVRRFWIARGCEFSNREVSFSKIVPFDVVSHDQFNLGVVSNLSVALTMRVAFLWDSVAWLQNLGARSLESRLTEQINSPLPAKYIICGIINVFFLIALPHVLCSSLYWMTFRRAIFLNIKCFERSYVVISTSILASLYRLCYRLCWIGTYKVNCGAAPKRGFYCCFFVCQNLNFDKNMQSTKPMQSTVC